MQSIGPRRGNAASPPASAMCAISVGGEGWSEVAREEAHLRRPAAILAGALVNEDQRTAAPRFLEKKPSAVLRAGVRHEALS